MKDSLRKLRDLVARFKFRFDMASGFLIFYNLVLLSIVVSDKLQLFLQGFGMFVSDQMLIVFIVVFGFSVVFVIGYCLDVKAKYWESYQKHVAKKNPYVMEILERVKNMERKLEEKEKK